MTKPCTIGAVVQEDCQPTSRAGGLLKSLTLLAIAAVIVGLALKLVEAVFGLVSAGSSRRVDEALDELQDEAEDA